MNELKDEIAIVGVAESDQLGIVPSKSALQHHAEAGYNALEDAGLKKEDVDGLFTTGWSTLTTAEYMGINPSFTDSTYVGGSSFVIHVAHAIAAINTGYCEVALITHGQTGRSSRGRLEADANTPNAQYEIPYGFIGAPIMYSLSCSRYMHEFGEQRTREAMAEIAISTRKWAQLNPKALMREPLTYDDYHNSRWITWPFHLLDCCLLTDAGAAVVITKASLAKNLQKPPVFVIGASEWHDHDIISQMPNLTSFPAKRTGQKAMEMAGITHKDIDLTMVYDSFTYTVLLSLEELGFCGKGESPDFVKGGRTAPGGDFPLNTSGGGLSYTHPGRYGIFLIVEAVRQLRAEANARQINDCNIALVNGTGGILSSTGTIVLAK